MIMMYIIIDFEMYVNKSIHCVFFGSFPCFHHAHLFTSLQYKEIGFYMYYIC